jgi:hypothetical protein
MAYNYYFCFKFMLNFKYHSLLVFVFTFFVNTILTQNVASVNNKNISWNLNYSNLNPTILNYSMSMKIINNTILPTISENILTNSNANIIIKIYNLKFCLVLMNLKN